MEKIWRGAKYSFYDRWKLSTEVVIADTKTGTIYCGIFSDPDGVLAQTKLDGIQKDTKNFNYEIMTFNNAIQLERNAKR